MIFHIRHFILPNTFYFKSFNDGIEYFNDYIKRQSKNKTEIIVKFHPCDKCIKFFHSINFGSASTSTFEKTQLCINCFRKFNCIITNIESYK